MATVDRAYLSSINFLDKRDILDKVLDLYEEDKTVMDMIEMTGRAKVTVQPEYHNFVNDWLYQTATIGSGSTAAASLSTDGDGYSTGTIVISSAADAPIVGELGMQPATGSIFLVTAVSGANVSVKSLNTVASGDAAYTANWTAGDIVVFFSTAEGEGASTNTNRRQSLTKESNYIQKFVAKTSVTDFAHASQIEVSFQGKNFYMLKETHDAYRKLMMDKAFAFLLGKRGMTYDANGNVVYTTDGVDHTITDRGGVSHTVSVAGVVDKDEIETMFRAMDKVQCPSEYWLWAGGTLDNRVDDLMSTLSETSQGGISYNSFGMADPKKKAIDLGVNSFRIYGRTIHKKRMPALDHQKVTWVNDNTGNNASKYPGYGYFLPTGKIKTAGPGGGEQLDRFGTRYMVYPDGKDTRYLEIHTGGLASNPTDDSSKLNITLKCTEGAHFLGVQHFARLDLNDAANY